MRFTKPTIEIELLDNLDIVLGMSVQNPSGGGLSSEGGNIGSGSSGEHTGSDFGL